MTKTSGSQRPSFKSSELARLLRLALPYRGALILGLIALAGGTGVNLLLPEVIRHFLNEQKLDLLQSSPVLVGGFLLGLFALQGICFYFRSYLFGAVGQKVVNDLRKKLYDAIIAQPISFFDTHRIGDLVSRISADTLMVQDAVSIKISVFIRYALQVAVGILLMVFLSLRLTVLILIVLPILIGLSVVLAKQLRKWSKRQQTELGNATTIAEETIGGVRIVKAFNRTGTESNRFHNSIDQVLFAGLSRTRVSAFFSSFVSFLMNASIIFVLMYGIFLVNQESLSIGDLTAFMLYGVIVAVSFAFLAGGYGEFVQALGAAERIFELLDREKEFEISTTGNEHSLTPPLSIEFKKISFSYPSRQDTKALKDLSFTLEPGTTTALVGPSGSGKSTIVNMLLRFYEPSEGELLFNGKSSDLYSPRTIRSHSALVPQDPQLFAVTLAENLRYGKPDATQAELEKACLEANILDFIESLPDGFETYSGERGVQLSGGQKQRIAIARALLRNPALLILDEATSALDSESEHLIQQALQELMKSRTSLVIAHRLSTIQNADQIVVLQDGKIVERGNHQTLLSQEGLYKRLVEKQDLLSTE